MSILSKCLHYYFRLTRGMTLGVRAIIVNDQRQVLLVKQTYAKGWLLPGGGVEIGETCEQAVAKEVFEEAGVKLEGSPRLISAYQHQGASIRDHVLLYECPNWSQPTPPKVPNAEIAAIGFFDFDDLPTDVLQSTKNRLQEWQEGGPYPQVW